jgi:DNA-binding MarR family transcriptional regulator
MEINAMQICEELTAAMVRLKTQIYELAESNNLRPQQFHIMHNLYLRGRLTMGQLAQALHCDPSNITGIVDRLVTQELVSREECPADRRAKALLITDKGRNLMDKMSKELPTKLGCTNLSAAQLYSLHEILSLLGA